MPDKFLTVEKLKRLLSYNKESGVFVWNITITSKAVAGSQAGTIRNGYVVITIDGEKTYLGIFKTAEEAHQIYLEAKKKHHEAFTN